MHPLRNHRSYIASIGHRLSGVGLAIFLPFHFWLLGAAFDGAEGLDRLLVYTDLPMVKIAEWGLVMLLALHLLFGIRLLILELSIWPDHSRLLPGWVVPGAVVTALVGLIFLIQVS